MHVSMHRWRYNYFQSLVVANSNNSGCFSLVQAKRQSQGLQIEERKAQQEFSQLVKTKCGKVDGQGKMTFTLRLFFLDQKSFFLFFCFVTIKTQRPGLILQSLFRWTKQNVPSPNQSISRQQEVWRCFAFLEFVPSGDFSSPDRRCERAHQQLKEEPNSFHKDFVPPFVQYLFTMDSFVSTKKNK